MSNVVLNSIDSDYELSTIIGNFSEEYIYMSITDALKYKYRPYNPIRMPNFPEQLHNQFNAIIERAGSYKEQVKDKEIDVFSQIINIICNYYNLSVDVSQIPEDQLYPLSNTLYSLLISNFSEKMLGLFTGYIASNIDNLVNYMPAENRSVKTQYSKKMYMDINHMIIYENMVNVIDILEGLDIDMPSLFTMIADSNTSNFICSYIKDCGDIYKNYFVSYLLNQETRTEMLSEIKIRFVSVTVNSQIEVPIKNIDKK